MHEWTYSCIMKNAAQRGVLVKGGVNGTLVEIQLKWTDHMEIVGSNLQRFKNSKNPNKNWIELTPTTHPSVQFVVVV